MLIAALGLFLVLLLIHTVKQVEANRFRLAALLVVLLTCWGFSSPSWAMDYNRGNLVGADFSHQDLKGAIFDHANLRSADFTGSDLRGARFFSALDISVPLQPPNQFGNGLVVTDTGHITHFTLMACRSPPTGGADWINR